MNQEEKLKLIGQFRIQCEERMSTKDFNFIDNRIDDLLEALGASPTYDELQAEISKVRVKFADELLAVVEQWKSMPENQMVPPFVFSNLLVLSTERDRERLGLPSLLKVTK